MSGDGGTFGCGRRTALKTLVGAVSLASGTGAAATGGTDGPNQFDGVEPRLVGANEEAGFNFPYFLYAPSDSREKPLVVEPVNSGSPSDDMSHHVDAARGTIRRGLARTISDELRIPFIVPVIKDPSSGEFRTIRTQSLDTRTMNIDSGRFARIDEQVLGMVDDARDRLSEMGLSIPAEFVFNGFSQSGNFANNFAALHPDRVASVTAGGINGMGTLPLEAVDGEPVDYQIGVADIEELTGSSFDEESWRDVSQLCYIGANERKPTDDTLPYSGVWSREQARRAVDVYGSDIQRERMPYSEAVYRRKEAEGRFEVYDRVGHDNSAPEIGRDVIDFHRRHLDIPYVTFVRGVASGAEELELDAFVPGDSGERLEIRAFVNGTDATDEPAPIRAGVSNRRTLSLTSSLGLDDTVEVGVFDPADSALRDAIHSERAAVVAGAEFSASPEPGDTSIEVEYETSRRLDLDLITDNGAMYWQRTVPLPGVDSSGTGTETFELDPHDEGVPFRRGDELALTAKLPHQPAEVTSTLDTVTVGGSGESLSVPDFDGDIAHDEVTVEFGTPPTPNAETIGVECSVDESFGKEVDLRLFPETGSGRWGIDADWDIDSGWRSFDRVSAGESVAEEFDVPAITFAEADTPALGANAELRAYPGDWGYLDDFVASANAVVSGARFASHPETGSSTVSVEFLYPDRYDETGAVRLSVDGDPVAEASGIDPGTAGVRTFDLRDSGSGPESIPSEADVAVSVGPADGEPFHEATLSALPADVADVSFAEPIETNDEGIAVDYRLDEEFSTGRFALLRLYSEDTSEWGVYLAEVAPGDAATERIAVGPDEPCVPFESGTEVEVKLVDWDDPYGALPLASSTLRVGEGLENASGGEREDATGDESNESDGEEADTNGTESDGSDAADDDAGSNGGGDSGSDDSDGDSGSDGHSGADDGGPSNDDSDGDGGSQAGGGGNDTRANESNASATDGETPGFTIPGAIAGVGGAAYALRRRLASDEPTE